MSERKVLNKYYPPDFDPSKIPRAKTARNKTFTVRLMAPCNMRCSTCGEYIYKGRKFNAKKEDVEDKNYLGLRIYRFYIKCTACLGEICFRTDPETTDYVLEAGATRNFEALRKAEDQADREEAAYQQELKANPMKLLEERTKASQNEMELVEALEEVREINKRAISDELGTKMLKSIHNERLMSAEEIERRDEEFIKSVFSGGSSIKRIEEFDDEEEESTVSCKKPKIESLSDGPTSKDSKNSSVKLVEKIWDKSVGSLSKSKNNLSGLVKRKIANPNVKVSASKTLQNEIDQVPATVGKIMNVDNEIALEKNVSNAGKEDIVKEEIENESSRMIENDKKNYEENTSNNMNNEPCDTSASNIIGKTPDISKSFSVGLSNQVKQKPTSIDNSVKNYGLNLIGAYSDSDVSSESD